MTTCLLKSLSHSLTSSAYLNSSAAVASTLLRLHYLTLLLLPLFDVAMSSNIGDPGGNPPPSPRRQMATDDDDYIDQDQVHKLLKGRRCGPGPDAVLCSRCLDLKCYGTRIETLHDDWTKCKWKCGFCKTDNHKGQVSTIHYTDLPC